MLHLFTEYVMHLVCRIDLQQLLCFEQKKGFGILVNRVFNTADLLSMGKVNKKIAGVID